MKWGTYFFNQGLITNPAVRDGMDTIERGDFLPLEKRHCADEDCPVEIGFGQTNSQPYTVAFMLELLDPQRGQKILDIGSGSGWTSAILAWIVSKATTFRRAWGGGVGSVYAVERIPELVKFGKENAEKYGFGESGILQFIQSDASRGFPLYAPYDRILVSAAFPSFPEQLTEQISDGGILVVPVETPDRGLLKVTKRGRSIERVFYPGFVFVPMFFGCSGGLWYP